MESTPTAASSRVGDCHLTAGVGASRFLALEDQLRRCLQPLPRGISRRIVDLTLRMATDEIIGQRVADISADLDRVGTERSHDAVDAAARTLEPTNKAPEMEAVDVSRGARSEGYVMLATPDRRFGPPSSHMGSMDDEDFDMIFSQHFDRVEQEHHSSSTTVSPSRTSRTSKATTPQRTALTGVEPPTVAAHMLSNRAEAESCGSAPMGSVTDADDAVNLVEALVSMSAATVAQLCGSIASAWRWLCNALNLTVVQPIFEVWSRFTVASATVLTAVWSLASTRAAAELEQLFHFTIGVVLHGYHDLQLAFSEHE